MSNSAYGKAVVQVTPALYCSDESKHRLFLQN